MKRVQQALKEIAFIVAVRVAAEYATRYVIHDIDNRMTMNTVLKIRSALDKQNKQRGTR